MEFEQYPGRDQRSGHNDERARAADDRDQRLQDWQYLLEQREKAADDREEVADRREKAADDRRDHRVNERDYELQELQQRVDDHARSAGVSGVSVLQRAQEAILRSRELVAISRAHLHSSELPDSIGYPTATRLKTPTTTRTPHPPAAL